jgi:hypothetical protein
LSGHRERSAIKDRLSLLDISWKKRPMERRGSGEGSGLGTRSGVALDDPLRDDNNLNVPLDRRGGDSEMKLVWRHHIAIIRDNVAIVAILTKK